MNGRAVNNEYLHLYINCKEFNCLPYEGGYLDQPVKIMSAFSVIQGVVAQYQQKGGK